MKFHMLVPLIAHHVMILNCVGECGTATAVHTGPFPEHTSPHDDPMIFDISGEPDIIEDWLFTGCTAVSNA